jgi:predicted permease
LITGITLADALNYKNSRDFKIGIFSNLALFLAAFIAYFFAKKEIMDVLQDQQAVLLVNILCGLLIVGAIVLLLSFFNVSKILIVMLYTFIGANLMWTINHASVFYQETKKPTTKQLADIIRINKRDDDLVFCYKRYYQDFPVYLNSTVGVVDFVGELEFGAKSDVNNAKLLTEDQFWKLWSSSDKRIFLLLSQEHYRKVFSSQNPTHRILDFNKYFVVIMNK